MALGAGALVPAVGVIVQLITRRRLDGVGGVVVVSVLATIALSLLSDNPRFLLAREGFITALWGLWFLATLRAGRPAAFRLAGGRRGAGADVLHAAGNRGARPGRGPVAGDVHRAAGGDQRVPPPGRAVPDARGVLDQPGI